MLDWLKKQITRDKAPGVQTMADLFSGDVLPTKVQNYFEPTPEVRTRDFFRELPGATANVAREIAQGTARSFDYLGRKVAPKLLPGYTPKKGSSPTMEQFLFGGAEKRGDTLRDVASTEWGLSKESMFAPLVGGVTVGLDFLPGGKGYKSSFEAIAKSTDGKQIFGILKALRPDVEDDALKNVSEALIDTKTGKDVKDAIDTLMPGTKDLPLSKPRNNKATKGEDGKFTGSEAGAKPQRTDTSLVHLTPEANLESIVKKGLVPSKKGYQGGGLYFGRSIDEAAGTVGGLDENVAIRIKQQAKDAYKFEEGFDNEFITQSTIKPQDLEVSRDGKTWEPLMKQETKPLNETFDEEIGKRIRDVVNAENAQKDSLAAAKVLDEYFKRSDPAFYTKLKQRTAQSGTPMVGTKNPVVGFLEEQIDYLYKNQEEIVLPKVQPPQTPAFDGLKGITLKTLEKLKGRTVVSSEFIQNLLRSQDVTKQERDAITEVLLTKGHKVNVKELAEEVQAQLLPLTRTDAGNRYASIVLPRDKQQNIKAYKETVYESPIETKAGDVHFSAPAFGNELARLSLEERRLKDTLETAKRYGETLTDAQEKQLATLIEKTKEGRKKGYFAHTRAEDLAEEPTRRVLEIQSDLFQKGRLEGEKKITPDLPTKDTHDLETYTNKAKEKRANRQKEVSRLEQYNQTWWKRIVREEVQKAKDDGLEYMQFPTGKTAMEIEGLGVEGEFNHYNPVTRTNRELLLDELEVGEVIWRNGTAGADINNQWVITDVLENGKFEAIPKREYEEYEKLGLLYEARESGAVETFDISGEVDTTNPIFKFYESDIGKYLNGRYNAMDYTDNKGVTWKQIDLNSIPRGAPVEAFAVAPIAGIETDEEGNVTGFDPVKAALGFAVVGGLKKASGTNAYKQAVEEGKNVLKLSSRRSSAIERYGLDEKSVGDILDAQRRQTIPHPQLTQMAGEIPVDFKKLVTMQPGTIVRGEQAEAYKQAVAGYKSYTRKLRANHLAKPTDILIKKQYDDAIATLTRAYANLEALYSEAGRVVESSKIVPITRSPIINSNIQKVRSQLPPEAQVKFDMDLENLDLDNPSEVMDFLTASQKTSWVQKVVEYYRASLLSAVTTNVVNASGNLLSTIADIPVRTMAGLISKGRTALTGAPRDVYIGEAWKLLSTGVRSSNDATIHAMRALMDEHYALQFNRSLVESGSQIPAIKGTKGKIIRLPYRLLSAMDMFFRTIKTNSEREALLYRRARQEGLEGTALMTRMEELRRKPPTDVTELVGEKADRALYLEEMSGILKDLENVKNRHPWTQMLVPFYRTLMNLMREAYRMTPARFMSKDKWITSKDTRTEEIARATLGTLAGLYMTNAIMDGRLEVTGAAPVDKKERDTFYGMGKIPYAIRVGDSWVPYQRVQPFSTILFTASKLADIWNFHKETGDMTPDDAADAASQLGSEISQFFVQQAPMQGIATFLEFLEGGKYNQGTLPAAGDFFAQMLGGFVPNIIYSGVRAYDPTIYSTEGIIENFKKRIPGMQDDLTPKRNALGEVSERPGTAMGRFLNPFNPSEAKTDPIYTELERLKTGVSYPTKKAFQQDINTKEYDSLMRDAGPRTREELWKLMQSRSYKNAPDDKKVEMIDDVVTTTRRQSVSSLFPHRKEQQMTMEQLLRAGATPKEAYELSRLGITDENAGTITDILLMKRKEEGKTPPTLQEMFSK